MIAFSSRRARARGEVNLTPMIDIIFNLLVFFLIIAVVSQRGMAITLPKADTAEARSDAPLEIMVTREGTILFDGKPVAEHQLEALLRAERARAEGDQSAVVTLKADEAAPFGRFILVMDTARKVGLTNLVIAAESKPGAREATDER